MRLAPWAIVAVLVAVQLTHALTGFPPGTAGRLLQAPLTVALELLAATICAARALRGPEVARLPGLLLAAGIASFAVGDTIFLGPLDGTYEGWPMPSDYFWGLFYLSAIVSLGIQARRGLAPMRTVFWLDGAIAGVTVAAVLAEAFFAHGLREAVASESAVGGQLAYPLVDMAWLGGFVAVVVAVGWRRLGGFRIAAAGVLIVLAADTANLVQVSDDSYEVGTILDSLWPIGFLLLAAARPLPEGLRPAARTGGSPALVPAVAVLASGLMLAASARDGEAAWDMAIAGALVAIALSVVRLLLTLVENENLLSERQSALQRAEESELGYRRILETTSEGVWIVDDENSTTFVNARMAEMLATTPAELIGRSMLDFVPRDPEHAARIEVAAQPRSGAHHREYPLERADGSVMWALVSSTPIITSAGTFGGAVAMINDITARKRAEQEIRFQAGLLDQVNASLVAIDMDGVVVYWSQGAEELYGWTAAEAMGRMARELIAPAISQEAAVETRAQVQTAGSIELDMELARKDGSTFVGYIRTSLIRDADGSLLGYVAVSMDITERKRAEAESRLLASIVESSHFAFVSTDTEGIITSWNAGAEALYRWPAAGAVGRHVDEVVRGNGSASGQALRARVIAGEHVGRVEARRYTREGRAIEVALHVSPIRDLDGSVVGASSMSYDITERKRVERAVAAQHAVASVVAEAQTVEEALPRLLSALGNGLGFDGARASLSGEPGPVQQADWARPGIEPNITWLEPAATIPVTIGGEVVGALEFFSRDVPVADPQLDKTLGILGHQIGQFVRRRQVEEDLRMTGGRLQAILDNTPAIVYVKDQDHRYLVANRQLEVNLGVDGSAEGRLDSEILPAELVEELRASDRRVLEKGAIEQGEVVIPRHGEPRRYVSLKFPLRDGNGRPYAVCGIATDITEHRAAEEENERLQAQLNQAQKLESVGQLAGGIAHDFNNLLAVILNYAEFAEEDRGKPDLLTEDITAIRDAAQRATELTRQLLIFSRREPVSLSIIDPNEHVCETQRLLARTLGENIEVVTRLGDRVSAVEADRGQLEQVLMNLAVNARDAIADTGTITIETSDEHVGPDAALDLEPGRYVRISVIDDGAGMPKEVAARAFDPFYTTKPRGSGTGLGLATVYGIAKQAGGTVELRSEEGAGTSVDVYMPAAEAEPEPPAPEEALPVAGNGERVLVVEDEAAVREVTCRTLARNGYDVIEAPGPAAALALFEEHDGQIDIVITDVVMPGGSGRALADELRARNPGLGCIFMSGYTDDVLLRHGASTGQVMLLEKPFSRQTLLAAVHAVVTAEGDEAA